MVQQLAEIVKRHLSMEEKELYALFERRMDFYTYFWLFLLGVLVGFLPTLGVVFDFLFSVYIQIGTLVLFPILFLVIISLVVVILVLQARGFPWNIQEKQLTDYLEARRIIRDRAKLQSQPPSSLK